MPAPTPPLFDVTVVGDTTRWRILVRGELDLRTGLDLVEVAAILSASGPPVAELDLADVSFVDSAGWHAVGSACAVLAEGGCQARITAMSPPATRLVDTLTSLDALVATGR